MVESCPPFRVLRHRASSSPIHLSEVTEQALRLITYIPLILRRDKCPSREGKSVLLVKGKAPSRSGFSVSMHVVLKTRYVNPNVHVRRY